METIFRFDHIIGEHEEYKEQNSPTLQKRAILYQCHAIKNKNVTIQ